MEIPEMLERAGAAAVDVARNVKPDQMTARTPCTEWDVRTLVNHLMLWSAFRSERAALKQPAPAEEPPDFTSQPDWASTFATQLDRARAAWSSPGALEGETGLAGGSMPAKMIAMMMVGELVVHGWDLARATGQQLTPEPAILAAMREMATVMGDMPRQGGAFGAEVTVPEDAPALDKVLGYAGRDPNWTP